MWQNSGSDVKFIVKNCILTWALLLAFLSFWPLPWTRPAGRWETCRNHPRCSVSVPAPSLWTSSWLTSLPSALPDLTLWAHFLQLSFSSVWNSVSLSNFRLWSAIRPSTITCCLSTNFTVTPAPIKPSLLLPSWTTFWSQTCWFMSYSEFRFLRVLWRVIWADGSPPTWRFAHYVFLPRNGDVTLLFWQRGRHSLLVPLQEKSHNLTRRTLSEKLDQMAFVNSKESIFLLWSIPRLEVLETLHILIPVRFMEKMRSINSWLHCQLNPVKLIFSLALCAEKVAAFGSHIYEMNEKNEWVKFICWKEDWVALYAFLVSSSERNIRKCV